MTNHYGNIDMHVVDVKEEATNRGKGNRKTCCGGPEKWRKKMTMKIITKVGLLTNHFGVSVHDVVIHEGRTSKEREGTGSTQNATQHVLSCLLQPMGDGVLKSLVPHHWS